MYPTMGLLGITLRSPIASIVVNNNVMVVDFVRRPGVAMIVICVHGSSELRIL